MKKILITLMALMTLSCANQEIAESVPKKQPVKEFLARVTYYWPGDGGQVGTITATGRRAYCGRSVAVDPRVIPYGTEIYIPKMGKTLVAVDTGSAVKSRKASKAVGRNNIVIDVFCANRSEARRRIAKYPMFMKIQVKK